MQERSRKINRICGALYSCEEICSCIFVLKFRKEVAEMKIQKCSVVLDGDCKNILVEDFSEDYKGVKNLDRPEEIVKVMNEVFHLSDKAEEYIYLICMTASCKPICFFEVGHGTHNGAMVGVREIFIRALLCGASHIVLVHNHPGGLTKPSKEDFCITGKIQEVSNLIGILFCDHIIISRNSWFSFAERGKMGGRNLFRLPE